MTIGELAKLFNQERNLGCDLRVIADGGLAPHDVARRDEPGLGESLAQHAQPDRGYAYPGIGLAGDD